MVSHRRYKQPTKLRIYIARLQGAILCYVFLYVFCFDFIFVSFTFYFGHNQGCKYEIHTTLKIYCNRVNLNRSIQLSCKREKKKKNRVMCNASYVCVHSLTCACWSMFKCPVTLIMNPVPLLVCKEIVSYPSYSHNMTRYTWMPIVVCVFIYGIRFSCSKNYRCECRQQPQELKVRRAAGLFCWIKWEVGEGEHKISKFLFGMIVC